MRDTKKNKFLKEFADGIFNPHIEMQYYTEDLTPNNIHTGEPQLTRGRIDHVNTESDKAKNRVQARWSKVKSLNNQGI